MFYDFLRSSAKIKYNPQDYNWETIYKLNTINNRIDSVESKLRLIKNPFIFFIPFVFLISVFLSTKSIVAGVLMIALPVFHQLIDFWYAESMELECMHLNGGIS